MKKIVLFTFIFIVTLLTVMPIRCYALGNHTMVNTPTSSGSSGLSDWSSTYNQNQTCNSILGDPNDENSVAWLLNKILTYTTIVGMLLVVVLSSIDFLKVIAKSDDEAMAKAGKKLALRLLFAGLLFFVPTLTAAILDIFGLTADCGIQQQ